MNFRRIKIKKEKFHFFEDVKKIHMVLIDRGFFATYEECNELWSMYSEDYWCASWVSMSGMTEQEIFDCVRPYFDPIDNFSVDMEKSL